MRPLFTVHAGEFIVGEHIEKNYSKKLNLWIPSKDTGVDLLVTNPNNTQSVSLQVKLSRDYSPEEARNSFEEMFLACGWLTLKRNKIQDSKANYWVICLISHHRRISPQYLIIKPKDLLNKLTDVHGELDSYHFYPWVTSGNTPIALDGRGFPKEHRSSLQSGSIHLGSREYTDYLNNWSPLDELSMQD